MLITLRLDSDKILRMLQAIKRDNDALLVEIETQANTQIVEAATQPPQPDIAARMAAGSAKQDREPTSGA